MSNYQGSLADHGGGVDHDDPNPEDEINKRLTDWLIREDETNEIDVYWDRRKSYNSGSFDITTRRRPDLLVDGKENCFAVEVKRGGDTAKLYKALRQVYQYWLDIETGEAEYTVNGNPKDVEAVLIATQYSVSGHLFEDVHNLDPRRSGRKRPEGDDDVRGIHYPTVEHSGSQVYVRSLYQLGPKDWAERYDENPSTGIGALYSSALDGHGSGETDAIPAAFHLIARNGQKVQNWDYIPFWRSEDV
jgi:hypothetical protein